MPRKKQLPPPIKPSLDYWTRFLSSMNLTADFLEEFPSEAETETVKGEAKAARDPMFSKFLYHASKYGAPASYSQFQKLSAQEKLYYLKAYEEWLKNIKKKGIKV